MGSADRYQNALSHLQKQYNLRSRNVPVTLNQKRKNAQRDPQDKETTHANQNREKEIVILSWDKTNATFTSNARKDKEAQSEGHRKESHPKGQSEKKDTTSKEVDKQSNMLSLENEISKLKVLIPLIELVWNDKY